MKTPLIFTSILLLLPLAAAAAGDASEHIATIEAYRAARDSDEPQRVWEYLAEGSRIWFEKKVGPGKERSRDVGQGPWAAWDDYFNASSEQAGEWEAAADSVAGVFDEINDFYRLCERGPSRLRIVYYFDDEGRISGTLVQGVSSSKGRYAEAEAWVREHFPDDHARLVVQGEIVPGLENAERWKILLIMWRDETGLPPIQ
jgi:hypothetical protein